jgi:hypothetical protein
MIEIPGPEYVPATKLGLQGHDVLNLIVDGSIENFGESSVLSPVHVRGLAQRVVVPR